MCVSRVSCQLARQFLSCLWTNLADALANGQGRSWLACHRVALLEGKECYLYLSCLWADLADTLVDCRGRL